MRNYENLFPILYTILGIFVIEWAANGAVGFVYGSGGNIAFDGAAPALYDPTGTGMFFEVQPGEIYPCDKSIQESGCKNSLAPLAGESGENGMFNSMPTGFYWDVIMFIILGLAGIGGTAYLQMHTKKMRAEHRKKKSGDESSEESESSDETDDEDEDSESDQSDDEADESDDDADDEEDDDSDDDDDDEEEDDSDDDDDEEEDDSDDDDEEDGIEIGSRVGVEDEDGDWYGEVVEFDDEEDAVVVKREDDGEEYLVDWDSLFQDD